MRRLESALGVLLASGLLVGCRCEAEDDHPSVPVPLPSAREPQSSLPLLELAKQARRRGNAEYQAPSPQEREEYGEWVRAVTKSGWSDRLPTKLPPQGFQGRLGGDGELWVFAEHPRHKRGGGFVAIRPGSGRALVVEAPHTFYDAGTLEIALRVFHELKARAFLANTMHRGGTGTKQERQRAALSGESDFDVAHNPATYFGAAHKVLIELDPGLLVVQIHGFADDSAPGVDAIVSAALTSGDARGLARAIQQTTDARARAYPDEINVLGATTNVQARVCRDARMPFLSIELSRSFRQLLASDEDLLHRFVQSLGTVVESPP